MEKTAQPLGGVPYGRKKFLTGTGVSDNAGSDSFRDSLPLQRDAGLPRTGELQAEAPARLADAAGTQQAPRLGRNTGEKAL